MYDGDVLMTRIRIFSFWKMRRVKKSSFGKPNGLLRRKIPKKCISFRKSAQVRTNWNEPSFNKHKWSTLSVPNSRSNYRTAAEIFSNSADKNISKSTGNARWNIDLPSGPERVEQPSCSRLHQLLLFKWKCRPRWSKDEGFLWDGHIRMDL